jgi:hypothetical protein
MDTCYAGRISFKKVDVQACILGCNCIFLFCFYSLLEDKTKCENSDIDGKC